MKKTYKNAIILLNSLQSNLTFVNKFQALNKTDKTKSINEIEEYIKKIGYSVELLNNLNVIHVAGTKGKGSTCFFVNSILMQYLKKNKNDIKFGDGVKNLQLILKIGLFTSPHLVTVRDRFRINNEIISEEKFTKYFFELWDKLSHFKNTSNNSSIQKNSNIKPFYFKYLTLLSYHIFFSENVNCVIYETGMGGKYDATNVIKKPIVVGITSLGFDHQQFLGETIESIAENKCGIFKKNVPAVVSKQTDYPQTHVIIKQLAKEKNVSFLKFVNHNDSLSSVHLGIKSSVQKKNALLAINLVGIYLKNLGYSKNEIPKFENDKLTYIPQKYITGLSNTYCQGRSEIIEGQNDFENIFFYLDGAHTVESINVASNWFKIETKKKTDDVLRIILYNLSEFKNFNLILEKLAQNLIIDDVNFNIDYILFTKNTIWKNDSSNICSDVDSESNIQLRFYDVWSELEKKYNYCLKKKIFDNIEDSLNFIKILKYDNKFSKIEVFACGSFYLIGGILKIFDKMKQ